MQPRSSRPLDLTRAAAPIAPDGERLESTLRLTVRNHPGVMSHVCGLFSRRAFNVERILCVPVGDGTQSAILLGLGESTRLDQLMRQLRKLEDVLSVSLEPRAAEVFASIDEQLARPSCETSLP